MKLLRRGRSIDRGDYPEYVCQVLCGKNIYTRLVAFVGFENPIGGLRLAVHEKKNRMIYLSANWVMVGLESGPKDAAVDVGRHVTTWKNCRFSRS